MNWTNVKDQAIHMAIGFLIGWLFGNDSFVYGFLAGCICGLIREVTEIGGSRITLDDLREKLPAKLKDFDFYQDLFFWGLGAGMSGL